VDGVEGGGPGAIEFFGGVRVVAGGEREGEQVAGGAAGEVGEDEEFAVGDGDGQGG